MKQPVLASLYLSLAASIWGGMYVVSKYVLDYIPPFTLVWLRYAVALIVLGAIAAAKRERPPKSGRDWGMVIAIGIIGYVVSISLQFVGTKWSNAHTASLITASTPAFVVLFARWLLGETLTWRKMAALLLATAGVIVIVGLGGGEESTFLGNICLVGGHLGAVVGARENRFGPLVRVFDHHVCHFCGTHWHDADDARRRAGACCEPLECSRRPWGVVSWRYIDSRGIFSLEQRDGNDRCRRRLALFLFPAARRLALWPAVFTRATRCLVLARRGAHCCRRGRGGAKRAKRVKESVSKLYDRCNKEV